MNNKTISIIQLPMFPLGDNEHVLQSCICSFIHMRIIPITFPLKECRANEQKATRMLLKLPFEGSEIMFLIRVVQMKCMFLKGEVFLKY